MDFSIMIRHMNVIHVISHLRVALNATPMLQNARFVFQDLIWRCQERNVGNIIVKHG